MIAVQLLRLLFFSGLKIGLLLLFEKNERYLLRTTFFDHLWNVFFLVVDGMWVFFHLGNIFFCLP